MKIAVLDCATWVDPSLEKYGSIADLVSKWLAPHLPQAELTRIAVAFGEAFPEVSQYDGYILPGSEAGVYDDLPWMAGLTQMLHDIRKAQSPLLGLCFGHQMMAQVYGGRAEKVDQGYCVGAREFEVEGRAVTLHVMHQDQVTQVPACARVTGRAEYCPNAVLRYEFPAISMQFHPEYDAGFVRDCIAVLKNEAYIDAEEAVAAHDSLEADTASAHFAREAAAFFKAQLNGAER